jgi:hypothetical protein
MRAHTHDANAGQCSAEGKAHCEAALVVESVVWPTVMLAGRMVDDVATARR